MSANLIRFCPQRLRLPSGRHTAAALTAILLALATPAAAQDRPYLGPQPGQVVMGPGAVPPPGAVLPPGTVLPPGAVLPPGTVLPPGAVVSGQPGVQYPYEITAPGAYLQDLSKSPTRKRDKQIPSMEDTLDPSTRAKIQTLIHDVQDPDLRLDIETGRSKLVRTRVPVTRVAIADPAVVEINQFSPSEFELIGRIVGETTLTLWFAEPQQVQGQWQTSLRYLIRVIPDLGDEESRRTEYGELQKRINELFPNSYVQLIAVTDKLLVRGQARDAREAAQIMAVIRDNAVDQAGGLLGPGSLFSGVSGGWGGYNGVGWGRYGGVYQGRASNLYGVNDWATSHVINMLEVPGEQQVLLKVRIAELNRGALRQMGAQLNVQTGDFSFSSNLNVAGAFQAVLDASEVQLALSALSSNRTTKVLAEPNLVTLSGYPASFIAGGQFALPTAVGLGGVALGNNNNAANAAAFNVAGVTTTLHGFGTQLFFVPTVLDKDHIRLQVAPTLSETTTENTVQGVPGLRTRSVFTTVDLREGQWLAIAGLLQDRQDGSKVRIPWVGDIPIVDTIFSRKSVTRDETELVILVSPELIHPLEPEQMPLILPGMEVTEPDDFSFFVLGRWEGNPDIHHRSTVWPLYTQQAFDARHQAIHAAKMNARFIPSQRYYVNGASGFSY